MYNWRLFGYTEAMEEFAIKFQDGSLKDGRNGLTVEEVVTEVIKRVSLYNSKVPCKENIYALEYLNLALGNLEARTEDRKERGVEETYEV